MTVIRSLRVGMLYGVGMYEPLAGLTERQI